MTAAHYIALLLLSTAAEGSREHLEIIEQNGSGIWVSLAELDLVEQENEVGPWRLSERGYVLVEHILALRLPEPVSAWRMPGLSQPAERMTVTEVRERRTPQGLEAAIRRATTNLHSGAADSEDDGPPPPKPPPPKPIPGITPAEDPQVRRDQALDLINRGFGTSEIADTLEMDRATVEQIFFGGP